MANKTKGWSYSAGSYGRTVRAYEDNRGQLFLEYRELNPATGEKEKKRQKLPHRNKKRAEVAADKAAARIAEGEPVEESKDKDATLRELFDKYGTVETPHKSERSQGHDRRTLAMFLDFFGAERPAKTLSKADWDRFIRARRKGATGPWGKATGQEVSNRTVARDLKLLKAVLNWATGYGDRQGNKLLKYNPLNGCKTPKSDPNQPTITTEEYEKLLEASREIDWRCTGLLILTYETGRRIGAVRQLRWADVDLDDSVANWRAENDKNGMSGVAALSQEAVKALREVRKERPGVGDAWVFPSPEDADKPCSRNLVKNWWRKMEKLGGVERVKGRGWHSLRRKLATDLKGEPVKDVMALQGWKTERMVLHYQSKPTLQKQKETLNKRRRRAAEG